MKTFAVITDTRVVALLVTVALIRISSGPNRIYPERPDLMVSFKTPGYPGSLRDFMVKAFFTFFGHTQLLTLLPKPCLSWFVWVKFVGIKYLQRALELGITQTGP